jgi:hypothetical protein
MALALSNGPGLGASPPFHLWFVTDSGPETLNSFKIRDDEQSSYTPIIRNYKYYTLLQTEHNIVIEYVYCLILSRIRSMLQ